MVEYRIKMQQYTIEIKNEEIIYKLYKYKWSDIEYKYTNIQ